MYIEIIPNLFISSTSNLQNQFNITINCHKISSFLEKNSNYKLKNTINISKDYEYLDELTTYIYKHVNNNKSVIVLSTEESQLYLTVICVYLIKYAKCKLKDAIVKINTKKELSIKNIIYIQTLRKFEKNFLSM